jgi:hypothetical protein
MPKFDKTGPQSQGPMTGWGLGPCGGCRRMGFGMGRGVAQTKEEKLKDIKAYKEALQEEIEETEKELADLQK